MVERDQGEGAESPEDEGVGDAGQGALLNDFRLEHHFGEEIPDALADGLEGEAGVGFGGADFGDDFAETHPESVGGGGEQNEEDRDFYEGGRGHLL
jgi:hypothetical protein